MNKKLANVLALLLSFIMIVSNPMSSLAQDAADRTTSPQSVRVTVPGNGIAYDSEEDETASSPTVHVTAPGSDTAYEPGENTPISADDPLVSEGNALISAGVSYCGPVVWRYTPLWIRIPASSPICKAL